MRMSRAANSPQVTVVIPTRNRLPLLREAVQSVRGQTGAEWELVVVDDASDDGTSAWLDQIDDPRVQPLSLPVHVERGVARNRGLALAQGNAVLFLDDDDLLAPGAVAALVEALERRPEAVAAVGAAVRFDPHGGRQWAPHPHRESVRSVWREVITGWDSGPGQALFITRALRAAGCWNEQLTYWELGDLWFRVARLGPVVFIPQTVLEIRLHAGQKRPNASSVDDRGAFVAALPEHDRKEGMRMLRARTLVLAADDARFRGEYRDALAGYLRAILTAPLLVRSPLTRTDLIGNLSRVTPRALLGRRGRAGVRRVRQLVERSGSGEVERKSASSRDDQAASGGDSSSSRSIMRRVAGSLSRPGWKRTR